MIKIKIKNLFAFFLVLCLVCSSAVLLSACGEPSKVYYRASRVDNVTLGVTVPDAGVFHDEKGYYVTAGQEFYVTLTLAGGYDIGSLAVYLNGVRIAMTRDQQTVTDPIYERNRYISTNPYSSSADFTITLSGEPEKWSYTLNLSYETTAPDEVLSTYYLAPDSDILTALGAERNEIRQGKITFARFKELMANFNYTLPLENHSYGDVINFKIEPNITDYENLISLTDENGETSNSLTIRQFGIQDYMTATVTFNNQNERTLNLVINDSVLI